MFKNLFKKKNDELHDRYFYDPELNRYVLGRRCDNWYYADVSYNGLSYYRSRWLGKDDNRFIEMNFEEWFQNVHQQITNDFATKIMPELS